MPETTEPQLTETQIAEIEARTNAASEGWYIEDNKDAVRYGFRIYDKYHQGVCQMTSGGEFHDYPHSVFIKHARADIPALIRDRRALQARIEALTTDWCECGHARDKHGFFSDHDECYECDQASEDLCCEWRPAPRPNENTALREQLAEVTKERDDARSGMMRICTHPNTYPLKTASRRCHDCGLEILL